MKREQITPLSFESLSADERRIVATAADGSYSVSYPGGNGLYQTPTDGGRAAGLSSLIDRVLDQWQRQTEAYRTAHPTAEDLPSHVDAVYIRYEGDLYCASIIEGDQKHYHCPGEYQ